MEDLFANIDKKLLQKFKDYHHNNPQVYQEFSKLTFEMMAKGREKYSAWTIINAIRWNHDLNHDELFKINNDFIALYARLFIHHNPKFRPFFELRLMKPNNRRESSEEVYREKARERKKLRGF